MLSGGIFSAAATVGTAVFRIVVSSDSMKNATATSQGTRRLTGSAAPPVGAELAGAGPIGAELVRMSAPLTSGRSYVGNSFIGPVRLSPPRMV